MLGHMSWSKGLCWRLKQLNSLWMTGGSQWLRWSCFEPFCFGWGRSLGGCAAATVVLGSQFALLRKTRVVPESPPWSRCGLLNGSPGCSTTSVTHHHMENNSQEHCAFTKTPLNVHAKPNTTRLRLMFVTCLVGYYSVGAATAPSFT